jgi:hypothetical protein
LVHELTIFSPFIRRAADEQAFRDAGTAKIKKTYTYDPTKPVAIKPKKI